MPRRNEKKRVEQPVCRHADKLGIEHIKLNVWGRRGIMDRIFFVPGGKPLMLEFKDPNGDGLSALQARAVTKLRKLGYDVHVVDNKEQGCALLDVRVKQAALLERQFHKTARLGAL